ncbi:MAG TPA: biosynthetic peptidoglycan transglycosylase [Chloroflexota bacterium]
MDVFVKLWGMPSATPGEFQGTPLLSSGAAPYAGGTRGVRSRPGGSRLRRIIACTLAVMAATFLLLAGLWLVLRPGMQQEVDMIPAHVHSLLRAAHAPYTPLSHVSPNMRYALVAIEDRRFYQHHGIDLHAIARSVVDDLVHRRLGEGGATLTVQLVERTIPLSANPLIRALKTLALAWVVEDSFSKARILELYLNDVYYGRGAYGIAAASRVYFARTPDSLTLAQSAFLAALPQAPSVYGAAPYALAAQARWRTVLSNMRQQGYITGAQEVRALHQGLSMVTSHRQKLAAG